MIVCPGELIGAGEFIVGPFWNPGSRKDRGTNCNCTITRVEPFDERHTLIGTPESAPGPGPAMQVGMIVNMVWIKNAMMNQTN